MQPLRTLTSVALPWPAVNCDTDQIIPARYLQKPRADNFGHYLFADLRFNGNGNEIDTFLLNRPPFRHARIIVTGRNFGCGSSREHAVWALYDYGFRAVVAPSLGDIFANNCLKNGLVPVLLPEPVVHDLLDRIARDPDLELGIDLLAERIRLPDGTEHAFPIDPFAKECLVNGVDELGYTLSRADAITAFEQRHGMA
ncbi:MAG: 3-isopropylmalate dehydratase small subunit [Ancalomicrobiaceae bacterium]|nr:3-isopropylmalate dehydratase small subunit [Ancalomicrobiaceae bacterium]